MAAMKPLVITDKNPIREWSRSMQVQGKKIGLVPTMGFLHEGHLSLVREAHERAHVIVVTIYVNPGQFAPTEDLSTYPSDFSGDLKKLNSVPGGVHVVFHPHNLYDYGVGKEEWREKEKRADGDVSCLEERGLGHETWIKVHNLEKGLCGKSRPIFFRGVATVVTKLFNIVEPDIAFFGKKDYQQWRIIQQMVSFHKQERMTKFRGIHQSIIDSQFPRDGFGRFGKRGWVRSIWEWEEVEDFGQKNPSSCHV